MAAAAGHSQPQSGRPARSELRPYGDSTGGVATRMTFFKTTRTSTTKMLAPVPSTTGVSLTTQTAEKGQTQG
ncbi:hypothetical protein CORC01_05166 [Colletotrichum orchidophilum]|uniref:Uncharacterized protein n=1 Tax=Colletotrichum orchidophilum TaxID=1209926 RepID=A0A1G4BE09_9PEZI|nr:uncharacterized protein CORC01_05166 [Colletotrichum orchidophilum]OHE99588.1 hypothetical protein CORC01_05166 [Colletotrichum orchidophilum]